MKEFTAHLKIEAEFDLSGYPPLIHHIFKSQPYHPLLQKPDLENHKRDWLILIKEMIQYPPKNQAMAEFFHTQWTVSHHFIRELVGEDFLVMDMLWSWLPRYLGPNVQLYRGENIERLEKGFIGTAWSTNKKTAQIFASGLNAHDSGGVVLETHASAEAIIAGPSNQSIYLGEYEFTVDWRKRDLISRTQFFPPLH